MRSKIRLREMGDSPPEKILDCWCGASHELSEIWSDFECHKCRTLYNAFGQELEPRENWDEEEYWDEE